ncbi:glycoside hydrolase family 5 protein [Rubripirellula amarantea]|nr:glycoside hydrolase family 5 protein [Rubripirellula amarantea]
MDEIILLIALANMGLPLGEPQRVQVRDMYHGKSVVGAQGELLRGASVAVFKFRRDTLGEPGNPTVDYATDPAFWDQMKASGVNAVRVVFFDAFQRSRGDFYVNPNQPFPFTSLSIADAMVQGIEDRRTAMRQAVLDRDALLADFDTIVELAAERQMYVMINYHDVTGYQDPDFEEGLNRHQSQFAYKTSKDYLFRFWSLIAPRYAHRTHVFYELMNEPVGYHPNDYSRQHVRDIVQTYHLVRALAPDTHIVLGSFTTPASFNERSMLRVAYEMERYGAADPEKNGVDFENASIGFHPYDISDLPHSAVPIREVMRRYAVINTELGLPHALRISDEEPESPGYFNDFLGSQSMERINVSWFAWNTFGPEEFGLVFEDIFCSDAHAKGYFWGEELSLAEGLARLQQTDCIDAQEAYDIALSLFHVHTDDPKATQ